MLAALYLEMFLPEPWKPENRDFANFLDSDVGKHFFSGAWGWFAVIVVLSILNTVLARSSLFRPLHLWATTFDTDGHFADRSNGRRTARFAHGYSTIEGQRFDASDLNPSWGYADGAITSTADDLATFYSALMRQAHRETQLAGDDGHRAGQPQRRLRPRHSTCQDPMRMTVGTTAAPSATRATPS